MLNRNPDVHPAVGIGSLSPTLASPLDGERPTAYADRVGEWYADRTTDRQRKAHGLFLTPVQAADFISARIKARGRRVRILDPAAGTGILCCAAVEAFVSHQPKSSVIELVAHEVDSDLIVPLRAVLDYLARWCRKRPGATVCVRIEATDFILANAYAVGPRGLFPACSQPGEFDAVIAKPPYFKIGKSDPRAAAVPEVVHGQPNIYALFMAVSAAILRAGGDFIIITPRSFASGPYFRRFRTVFFDMIRPTGVHVFGSRRDAFRRDEVLQENVILCGVRQDRWHEDGARKRLVISSSLGVADSDDAGSRELPARAVLDFASVDKVLRFPVCDEDNEALALVDSWPTDLHGLGLNISTGPVVSFRATKLVAKEGNVLASHAPLPLARQTQRGAEGHRRGVCTPVRARRACSNSETQPRRTWSSTRPALPISVFQSLIMTSCRTWCSTMPSATGCFSSRLSRLTVPSRLPAWSIYRQCSKHAQPVPSLSARFRTSGSSAST